MDRIGEAEVIAALERAGLPTSGPARLFHAASTAMAAAIEGDGTLRGGESGVVWLASSGLIRSSAPCRRGERQREYE